MGSLLVIEWYLLYLLQGFVGMNFRVIYGEERFYANNFKVVCILTSHRTDNNVYEWYANISI